MLKKILVTFVALVAGCAFNIGGLTTADPVAVRWNGDVALLNLVHFDGVGSCSGWMITPTELVTAGHCAERLIAARACFYPDLACASPILLTLVGADHIKDVALFRLPKGVVKRAFPVRMAPLSAGETVYTVGYPMGEFSITSGLYAWTHPAEMLYDCVFVKWLDHSALAAPGSSGSALVDSKGNLVGMTIGAHTYGPRINFQRSIASGTDTIMDEVVELRRELPPRAACVIGEPTITRGAP